MRAAGALGGGGGALQGGRDASSGLPVSGSPIGGYPPSASAVAADLNAASLSQQYASQGRIEFGQYVEDGFRDSSTSEAIVVDRRLDNALESFFGRCRKKLRKAKDEATQAMVLALLVSETCGRSGVHATELGRRHEELTSKHRDFATGDLLLGDLLGERTQQPEQRSTSSAKKAPTGAALVPQRALLFKALADWLNLMDCMLERPGGSAKYAAWNVVQLGSSLCLVDLLFDPGALYEESSAKADEYRRLLAEGAGQEQAPSGGRSSPPEAPSARKELAGFMPRPTWHVEPWELEVMRGSRIGRGGFGEVFHGRWEGMHVAVKEVKETTPTDAEVVDFTLEISLLSQLNHPNVVRFWRGCTEMLGGSRKLLMITEYVRQGGLSRLLHGHGGPALPEPLTLPQALSFGLDIARGVQYLHNQKILHLDLKSPNVLCATAWTAKLCDFGLAKIRGEATMVHSTLQGVSPVWAPPEMFDDRAGGLTEKADVYSFAIIFFELLTKKVPFQEVSAALLPSLKVTGQLPQIPAGVPEDCAALIKQGCSARLATRPSMSGVVARLKEFATSRGLRLSEVKPPAALLRLDGGHEQRVREAEEDAAQRLVELDGQRLRLRSELSELQRSIEQVRRRGNELAAKAASEVGGPAGDTSPDAGGPTTSEGSLASPSMSPTCSGGEFAEGGLDAWCKAYVQDIAGAKFRCTLCSKVFRGPDFAHRHVCSKHQDARIENAKPSSSKDAYFDCDVSAEDSIPVHRSIPARLVPSAAGGNFNQALQEAAEQGEASRVASLLSKRADVGQQDDGGSGPLLVAARGGHVEAIVALLSSAGVDGGSGVVGLLASATGAGLTPLHAAASEGHRAAVALLLQRQAAVDAVCARGKSSLLYAGEGGHSSVCDLLVGASATVGLKTPEGETLLHVAARCGDAELISRVVAWRGDLAAEDRDGWTPLHEAAHWGAAAVEALCKARANVHARSRDGETPLHVATEGYEQASACQALLQWGADPLAPDVDGESALHVAVRRGNCEACHVLLQGGAEANAVDHAGRTPLDLAESDEVRCILLGAGAAHARPA